MEVLKQLQEDIDQDGKLGELLMDSKTIQQILDEEREKSPLKGLTAKQINLKVTAREKANDPAWRETNLISNRKKNLGKML